MFEKPWTSIKRMLLTGLCLTTLLAPYESEAAPKNKNRSTRLSKKVRQETKRQNKRQQQQSRQQNRKTVKPTLEENLSPAQVDRKIQTIRKRIETAPENRIPAKYKETLLDVFDDMAQTQMGRYIFEKAHPDLNFKIEHMPPGYAGTYGSGDHYITFAHGVFEDVHKAKTPEQKLYQKLYIAHVTAHEATHSIQFVNNMNDSHNMSFEEKITINKLFELNSILNETIVRYQIGNLSKHRHMLPNTPEYRGPKETEPGKVSLVPMHLFYKELKEAKMATGVDEKTAERFARTKFVESFWQNNGKTPIQIGNKTILPTTSRVAEVSDNWNATYNRVAFKSLPHNQIPYQKAMTDIGITKNILRFVDVMGIDTPPSFFRDPKTTSFKMQNSNRLIAYADGIRSTELDALTAGAIIKGYKNGKLHYFIIETSRPHIAKENRSHTDYHEGTNIKKATYAYRNGKMNGIYREYDRQGNQIMEVPVENNNVKGDGWIVENGKRILKTFYANNYLKNRTRQ